MAMVGKLTALKVAREKEPGLYGDGGGLYLQITVRGSKSWIFASGLSKRSGDWRDRARSDHQEGQGAPPRNGIGRLHHRIAGRSAPAGAGMPQAARKRNRPIDARPARTAAQQHGHAQALGAHGAG